MSEFIVPQDVAEIIKRCCERVIPPGCMDNLFSNETAVILGKRNPEYSGKPINSLSIKSIGASNSVKLEFGRFTVRDEVVMCSATISGYSEDGCRTICFINWYQQAVTSTFLIEPSAFRLSGGPIKIALQDSRKTPSLALSELSYKLEDQLKVAGGEKLPSEGRLVRVFHDSTPEFKEYKGMHLFIRDGFIDLRASHTDLLKVACQLAGPNKAFSIVPHCSSTSVMWEAEEDFYCSVMKKVFTNRQVNLSPGLVSSLRWVISVFKSNLSEGRLSDSAARFHLKFSKDVSLTIYSSKEETVLDSCVGSGMRTSLSKSHFSIENSHVAKKEIDLGVLSKVLSIGSNYLGLIGETLSSLEDRSFGVLGMSGEGPSDLFFRGRSPSWSDALICPDVGDKENKGSILLSLKDSLKLSRILKLYYGNVGRKVETVPVNSSGLKGLHLQAGELSLAFFYRTRPALEEEAKNDRGQLALSGASVFKQEGSISAKLSIEFIDSLLHCYRSTQEKTVGRWDLIYINDGEAQVITGVSGRLCKAFTKEAEYSEGILVSHRVLEKAAEAVKAYHKSIDSNVDIYLSMKNFDKGYREASIEIVGSEGRSVFTLPTPVVCTKAEENAILTNMLKSCTDYGLHMKVPSMDKMERLALLSKDFSLRSKDGGPLSFCIIDREDDFGITSLLCSNKRSMLILDSIGMDVEEMLLPPEVFSLCTNPLSPVETIKYEHNRSVLLTGERFSIETKLPKDINFPTGAIRNKVYELVKGSVSVSLNSKLLLQHLTEATTCKEGSLYMVVSRSGLLMFTREDNPEEPRVIGSVNVDVWNTDNLVAYAHIEPYPLLSACSKLFSTESTLVSLHFGEIAVVVSGVDFMYMFSQRAGGLDVSKTKAQWIKMLG